MKKKRGVVISKGAQYHNPDAVTRLIGPRNIARVEVNGVEMKALMDSGSQVNMMTEKFLKKTGLILRPLENLGLKLGIEGSAGTDILYLGYTEANLRLPTANNYSSDQLFLIVEQCIQFGEQVPIQVVTTFQDEILTALPSQDLVGLVYEVKRGIVCRVVLHATQLTVAEMRKEIDEEIAKTQKEVEWDLVSIKGKVKFTKAVTVPPKGELQVVGVTAVKGYTKRCHVIVEPYGEKQGKYKVTPVYTDLKPGSLRVKVLVTNDSNRPVQLPAKMVIGVISAANVVPAMIAPKNMLAKDWDQSQSQLASCAKPKEEELARRGKLVVEQIDLSSIQNWSQSLQQQVRELLMEFQDIFALNDLELGRTNLVKHHIPLTNPVPFKDRYTRIPPSQFEPLRKLLKNMEEVGAIRKSNSPWSSSIVLVKKKDGNLRFCIDLRKLNARTIKDANALPRIDETLDYLAGSKWFSALDLKLGYWQVELDEESKPLTAFTAGPLGFYECKRMPFGATKTPATFQRMMETCLGDLHLNWCLIYLDDIIVFAKTQQEAITRLGTVFQKLREAGLKLQPLKCELFKTSLLYLGHIVSEDGIRTDPKKVEVIHQWPAPVTVTDVRSFLGLTNYYRRFLEGYAKIARPLNDLISGENADKKKTLVEWTPECQDAFEKLKSLCTEAPVLAYPDFTKPFKLHIDACDRGLGAILYQDQPSGQEKPISFASRSLSKVESNYPAHKLEFLALKWAVTKRFHEYLYGNEFTVYTDNNPLTYILTTAKLDATGHRWVAALAAYNFTLHYRPGKANIDADALSRIPWKKE